MGSSQETRLGMKLEGQQMNVEFLEIGLCNRLIVFVAKQSGAYYLFAQQIVLMDFILCSMFLSHLVL